MKPRPPTCSMKHHIECPGASTSQFPAMGLVYETITGNLDRNHLLPMTLSAAVPLRAEALCKEPLATILDQHTLDHLREIIHDAGEYIIHRDDSGQNRTANGFNALAEALARLAFLPGGVKCFGTHWEYKQGVSVFHGV